MIIGGKKKPLSAATAATFPSIVILSLLVIFSSLVLVLPGTTATTINYSEASKAYAQLGMSPFTPPSQRVLPTYIDHIVPGAASKNSLYHYYPPSIAVPEGTTVAWFNDDPGQPRTYCNKWFY